MNETISKNDTIYVDIFKALSNINNLRIVRILKDPNNFPLHTFVKEEEFYGGVSAREIQNKFAFSKRTITYSISQLQKCGILEMKRMGRFTYYRRNEEVILKFERLFSENL